MSRHTSRPPSTPPAGSSPPAGSAPGPRFQTTRWSLIAEAGESSSPDQRAALADLCRTYWQPVYSFARRSGLRREVAEDITQDFFADLVDGRALLTTADSANGKFRTYVLAALKNRIANHRRGLATVKRGGRVETVSIFNDQAETRYGYEPIDGWTAEKVFHRRWALTLLENVLARIEQRYQAAGRERWFALLRPFLTTEDRPDYDELSHQLETTASAVRVAVHRIRKQYREELIGEIRKTIGEDDSVADERRWLMRSLGGDV